MSSERGRRVTAIITAIALAAGSMAGGAGKLQEAYAAEETTEAVEKPVEEKGTEEKDTERKEEESTERNTEEKGAQEATEEPSTEEKEQGREPEEEIKPAGEEPVSEAEKEKESTRAETEADTEESTEPETENETDSEAPGQVPMPQVRPYRAPVLERTPTTDVTVPIYDYEIINVTVPASYAVAFNPYRLTVRMGENQTSDKQVLSRNYGIVNKSSRDMLVTVTLLVEDQNGGRITFVDSAEAALHADKDTYAIYLTAVPADERGVRFGGSGMDEKIAEAGLAETDMTGATDQAVTLYEGKNQMAFRLSRARYDFREGMDITLGETPGNDIQELLELRGLASDGTGATAFTFDGVMNEKADWTKLKSGIRISVVYTYETASGEEQIVQGTNAMVPVEK